MYSRYDSMKIINEKLLELSGDVQLKKRDKGEDTT